MTRTIDHHASIVIVRAGDLFFFNGYDSGYPRPEWRGFLNPLGGNHEPEDLSPYSLLEREVREEMSDPQKKFKNFACDEAEILKQSALKNVRAYQDFVIVDPIIEKNKDFSKEQRSAIVSFYEAEVPLNQIERAIEALSAGKRLVSEGDGGNVVSLDELISGAKLLAWTNPFMMLHYLGQPVPYLRRGEAEPIGMPRQTLGDYLHDFNYLNPVSGFPASP